MISDVERIVISAIFGCQGTHPDGNGIQTIEQDYVLNIHKGQPIRSLGCFLVRLVFLVPRKDDDVGG